MSNTNINFQTQTSNALHNAIMEAGGKDRPPMLAPVTEGSLKTTTEGYIENYKNFSQDIRDQLNAEAEAVQIILTGIDNDIYSTVDACPNACEIRANQENSPRINKGTGYDNQRVVNVVGDKEKVARECQKPKRAKDAAYHKEKMLLCKQEEAGFQLNAEQADWRDDTDDEPEDQELEAHYMYMAQIQEVTPDAADNSGPIFDAEPLQKVQNNDDNYNVFAIESEHPEQPESVNDTYPVEQDEHNIIIDSLDMSYDREQDDQDDNDDLAKERDLLASLIEKLKCEIDDSKNRNKFLETSNKALVDKLKGEIEDFKTKNKSLESSNNHFKEANNELSKTNQLMFKDLKKFQAELDRYHDVNYASKVAIDCAKAKGDLMSYKMESKKSFNEYTRKINDLNQTILEMRKELFAHQETISIMSQEKEAQKKFHNTREDNELEKFIALENKIKVLDDILYKTGQSVQTVNMLNRNCKTSCVQPEFLKKAQRANPRLYDIGTVKFGNDQIALILGYGDLVQGNITIKMVYYVEGINHNLFFVGQFCDTDLEVSFRKSTCYIRDLKGNDLLVGSRTTDLYSITLQETSTPNLICLMAKATSSQAWLWHRRLLHLNFDTINLLLKYDIVTGYRILK
ncbi:retrovirus-related pol polyprotein from transposon TNT 1-94 [Tanacetum coccineum]